MDCGGDIAVGGVGARLRPYQIDVEHPLTGAPIGALRLARGGVATSGLNVRIWRGADGRYAHHLLDPSTGAPAWTGLIGVTAVSPTGRWRPRRCPRWRCCSAPRARDRCSPATAASSSTTAGWSSRSARSTSAARRAPRAGVRVKPAIRPRHLVAGQPRLGHRRAGADLALGDARLGDGRQARARPPQAGGGAPARVRALIAPGGDRAPRRGAARRRMAEAGLARDHGSLRARLPARRSRGRDHRRLSGAAARAELLPAPPNRRAALAQAAPGDRRSCGCSRSCTRSAQARTRSAPWLRAVVLAPAIPIVYLLVLRVLGGQRAGARTASGRDQRPATASGVPSQPRRPRHDEQRRGRLQHQPVRDTP